MTSRSWQCISCHWNACSNHLAISDFIIKLLAVMKYLLVFVHRIMMRSSFQCSYPWQAYSWPASRPVFSRPCVWRTGLEVPRTTDFSLPHRHWLLHTAYWVRFWKRADYSAAQSRWIWGKFKPLSWQPTFAAIVAADALSTAVPGRPGLPVNGFKCKV